MTDSEGDGAILREVQRAQAQLRAAEKAAEETVKQVRG
jgi:hypothetical protein